jgi:hypothetical protein
VLLGRWAARQLGCGATCDKKASLVAEMEVHFESSHGFSDGGFGAPLKASYVEEANFGNQVVAAAYDGSCSEFGSC